MKAYISLDNQAYKEKPQKQIVSIKYRTADNWGIMDIKDIAEYVGNKGHAMIPAHLVGGIASANCQGMQIFALDFDSGCRFEEIRLRSEQLGIPITFAYHTYSSTEEHEKFRVVFIYECLIEDVFAINIIIRILHKIFPECDSSCKNLDRIFLGGKALLYLDENACISGVQLYLPLLQALEKSGHYKRNIDQFSKETKVKLYNSTPVMGELKNIDLFGESMDLANIHIIGESTKTPFFIVQKDEMHPNITCKRKLKKLDINNTESACKLLDEFNQGEQMGHEAKFAILLSLLHINGGKKHFLKIIQSIYGEENYIKWERHAKYIEKANYHAKKCSKDFCPYFDLCQNVGSIKDALERDRKVYREKEEYYSLEAAYEQFRKNLDEAVASVNDGLHLIRAQTSMGKTEAYIDLISKTTQQNFLIAVPTNKLKNEVTDRLISAGVSKKDIFKTVSINDSWLIPNDVKAQIAKSHEEGFHQETKKIIAEYYESIKDSPMLAVKEECEKILAGIRSDEAENARIVVTTHAYLVQMPCEFLRKYSIIIDEDILLLQFFNRIYSISESCLEAIKESGFPGYSSIATLMLQTTEGKYARLKSNNMLAPLTRDEISEVGCMSDDNINDLASAEAFVKQRDSESGDVIVKYFCPQKLPKLKYIVLSATLNGNIYQKYFADTMPVFVYTEKKSQYLGRLIQYTFKSLGRADLLKNLQVFFVAKKIAGKSKIPIITFKRFAYNSELVGKNEYGLHFGNTAGIDKLKGKDIIIIGTPYKAEEGYKLVACCLGANVNTENDKKPRMRRVTYKKCNFLAVTYEDSLLREIQQYSLESELEQCIGRARLLRHNCTVYLFSSFPCEQAILKTANYIL